MMVEWVTIRTKTISADGEKELDEKIKEWLKGASDIQHIFSTSHHTFYDPKSESNGWSSQIWYEIKKDGE